MLCPYCHAEAKLVGGAKIYPHRFDLHEKRFYLCSPCNAYVGCHPGTDKPLGRLADKELREAKMKAHSVFDPLWKSKTMKRSHAYGMLAERLGISKRDCHIGMFDVATCKRVVEVLNEGK
jgi:hypothetical protein